VRPGGGAAGPPLSPSPDGLPTLRPSCPGLARASTTSLQAAVVKSWMPATRAGMTRRGWQQIPGRAEGRTPPTWTLAQRLIAAGAAGVMVPSFAASPTEGMRTLVPWRWGGDGDGDGDGDGPRVVASDEGKRLPQ